MKKVLKKTLAAICILTMILSMTIVAGAATSPSGTEGGYGSPSGKDDGYKSPSADDDSVDGISSKTEGVFVYPFDGHEYYAENEQLIKTEAGIKKILGKNYKEGTTLTLLGYVDIEKWGSASNTVTVSVKGVKKGDTIYVLHYAVDRNSVESPIEVGEWEVITPDSVDDEEVTFTSTSFSPFAFVKATNTKISTDDSNSGSSKKDDGQSKADPKANGKGNGNGSKATSGNGNSAKKASGNAGSTVKKSPKTGEF